MVARRGGERSWLMVAHLSSVDAYWMDVERPNRHLTKRLEAENAISPLFPSASVLRHFCSTHSHPLPPFFFLFFLVSRLFVFFSFSFFFLLFLPSFFFSFSPFFPLSFACSPCY